MYTTRKITTKSAVNQMLRAALKLRGVIAEIIDTHSPEHIFLTPGALISLHILFASLKVERIALTMQEYYTKDHFPAFTVKSFTVERFVRDVLRFKPQAVIVSLVTWRGEVLPVEQLFREIRGALGPKTPLLIADYAHAGAIGFPSPQSVGADIVCGDFYKWIAPPDWYKNLGFIWLRTHSLALRAHRAFTPFFLSTDQPHDHRYARWVNPQTMMEMSEWFDSSGINRTMLLERHKANMELATNLAERLGLKESPQSSILWLKNERKRDTLLAKIVKQGLLWNTPEGSLRILCRAEAIS